MQLRELRLLKSDHERTFLIKKNVLVSLFVKGGSVLITFLLVPLTINYINPVQYGIWLTLSSLVYWIGSFNLGIGNGLKNEIAYSLAVNDESNVKKYVSTSYALLTIIALLLFLFFFISTYIFDYNYLFNTTGNVNYDITPVLAVFLGFLCVQFVLQLIDSVISATQQIFISSFILFLGQLAGLIIIYVLTLLVPGSLLLLVLALAGSSVAVVIISSIYLYSTKFKKFAPAFKCIDFKHIKRLLGSSSVFFLIQIGAMFLLYTNNFIIARILGPEAVTTFNIPFRLFSVISMLFAIIIVPYWSAFTDAYAKKDFDWIKINIKKLRNIWLYLTILGLVILLLSNSIYKIWINEDIAIPITLSFSMFLYTSIFNWQTLHVYFLNGIGKIKLQLLVVIVCSITNIPLTISLGKVFGLTGVVIANTIIFLIMAIVFTVQYNKIINNTAQKIWNR